MTRRNHGPKINTQTKATTPHSAMISAHHPVTVSKGRKARTNTQKRRRNLTVHPKRASLECPLQISATKSMKRRKTRRNETNMDMRKNSIDHTVPSLVNSNMSSPASFTSDISSATMEGDEKPEKKSGISKDHFPTTSVQTEPNDMEDELSSDLAIRQTQWPEIERAWMSITIIKTRMSNWEHVLSEKDKRGTRATVRDLDGGSWSLHSTHYLSLLQNANNSKGLTPPWETPYISFEHIGDEKRFAAGLCIGDHGIRTKIFRAPEHAQFVRVLAQSTRLECTDRWFELGISFLGRGLLKLSLPLSILTRTVGCPWEGLCDDMCGFDGIMEKRIFFDGMQEFD